MRFTGREKKDLFMAGVIISLAFAILLGGGSKILFSTSPTVIIIFLTAFFSAGIGFLLHEIMHKYVAQSYGLRAEFFASYPMLFIAILFSFFGFIFAAPGAVYISGFNLSKEKNGKISIAGPMTNLILAVLFLFGILIFWQNSSIKSFFEIGMSINSLLAAFNMIPIMPFDGAKVLAWNKAIYGLVMFFSIGLFILSWFI